MKALVHVIVVLCLFAPLLTAGEEDAASPPPGVYLGEPPQSLCSLTAPLELEVPVPPPEEGLPRVRGNDVELEFRVSEGLMQQGLSPRGLRLVHVRPANTTAKFKVVSTRIEADRQDHELWHVYAGQTLAPGVYDLAMERPGWSTGLSSGEFQLYFLGCNFIVEPDEQKLRSREAAP